MKHIVLLGDSIFDSAVARKDCGENTRQNNGLWH